MNVIINRLVPLVLVGGLTILIGLAWTNEDSPDEPACSASKRVVQERLAGRAYWGDCISQTNDGAQTVTLLVDSRDTIGLLVRSQWIAQVHGHAVISIKEVR